jgi:hypothetical protein
MVESPCGSWAETIPCSSVSSRQVLEKFLLFRKVHQ